MRIAFLLALAWAPAALADTCFDELAVDKKGMFAHGTDGKWWAIEAPKVDGTKAVVKPTKHIPARAARKPPRLGPFVEAAAEAGKVTVRVRDEKDKLLLERTVNMPRTPAVGDDGKIGATGSPCAMGVSGVTWWDVEGLVIQVEHSIGDVCDERVPDICTVLVLRTPKDLPVHD